MVPDNDHPVLVAMVIVADAEPWLIIVKLNDVLIFAIDGAAVHRSSDVGSVYVALDVPGLAIINPLISCSGVNVAVTVADVGDA